MATTGLSSLSGLGGSLSGSLGGMLGGLRQGLGSLGGASTPFFMPPANLNALGGLLQSTSNLPNLNTTGVSSALRSGLGNTMAQNVNPFLQRMTGLDSLQQGLGKGTASAVQSLRGVAPMNPPVAQLGNYAKRFSSSLDKIGENLPVGNNLVGGKVGNYIGDLKNTYGEAAKQGGGILGKPLTGLMGVGTKLGVDTANRLTGNPIGQPLEAWKYPAMASVATAPNFKSEGKTDPLSGLNPADRARLKLNTGQGLDPNDLKVLRPTADNAFNTLSDSVLKKTTGMTKDQLKALSNDNIEEYIRLLAG